MRITKRGTQAASARVFAVRLPEDVLRGLRALARSNREPPATLARELIERGVKASRASEPATSYAPASRGDGHLLTALIPGLVDACKGWNVKRLTLFGSFVSGDPRPDSDVDLCVEFLPMRPSDHAASYFGLLADLERLFRREIDLVERGAVTNSRMRAAIERSEIPLYESA